jgi:hypothetical protein
VRVQFGNQVAKHFLTQDREEARQFRPLELVQQLDSRLADDMAGECLSSIAVAAPHGSKQLIAQRLALCFFVPLALNDRRVLVDNCYLRRLR